MKLRIKEGCKEQGGFQKEWAKKMGIPDMALRASLKGNPTIGILATVANAPGVPVTEPFEQPKNDTVNLTCPYGRKNINFKVE